MCDAGAYSDDMEALSMVTIPAKRSRASVLSLRILGVAHRFVFPDLGGVVASIRAELREA